MNAAVTSHQSYLKHKLTFLPQRVRDWMANSPARTSLVGAIIGVLCMYGGMGILEMTIRTLYTSTSLPISSVLIYSLSGLAGFVTTFTGMMFTTAAIVEILHKD